MSKAKYRAEVDGLRAIAVLAVMFGHYNLFCTGGYVGVSVFLVISGYLITGIVKRELEEGSLSFSHFYERRVRRILPAASVVMLVSLVVGYFILSPKNYAGMARMAGYQVFFSGNIYEALSSHGYFSEVAMEKPLLHYWSLAVEEQFYLIFPALLVLCFRFCRKGLVFVVAFFAILSFASGMIGTAFLPEATYYLTHARAWELLIGALVALCPVKTLDRPSREVLGALCLLTVCATFVAFDEKTLYPGVLALVPTLGTAGVIIAGGETVVGRILSIEPLRFIGRISYSLYLWHWPLLVFASYYSLHTFVLWERVGLCVASVGIAYLSFCYVEEPLRRSSMPKARVFVTGFALSASVVIVASTIVLSEGWPGRFWKYDSHRFVVAIPDEIAERPLREVRAIFAQDKLHKFGAPDAPLTFVVVGDSHTIGLRAMFNDLALQHGVSGRAILRSATLPVPGTFVKAGNATPETVFEYHKLVEKYIYEHGIKNVILVGRWTRAVTGKEGGLIFETGNEDVAGSAFLLRRNLTAYVKRLGEKGVKVWILLQPPEHDFNVPNKLMARHGRVRGVSREKYESYQGSTNDLLRFVGAEVLDPSEYLIGDDGYTRIVNDSGCVLWNDHDHLNRLGGLMLKPLFEPVFQEFTNSRMEELKLSGRK